MKIEDRLRMFEEWMKSHFFGKYEAVVTNTDDPLEIGRVRARIPAVFGENVESGWALPCAPFGGGKDRGFLFLPEVGDTVWMEFAGGDPSRPIWSGVFWGAPDSSGQKDDLGEATGSEVPTCDGVKAGPRRHILRTKAGHRLFLDDDGGIVVLANGDDKTEIRLDKDGEIVIKAEKIKLGDGASKAVILGDDFQQLFNQHTHLTGVGQSAPPTQPLTSQHLSTKTFTE